MLDKLCIIAGERSGDLYGGRVVKELKIMNPNLKVFGIGGDNLLSHGAELLYNVRQMAFMGFFEVIKHLPFINEVMDRLIEEVKKQKPDIVLLIDYPGFNLKFAKKIRKYTKKIIYYISPQLWAWGSGRVEKVRKYIDKMIVIFPFEKEFYKSHNIDVEFTGHPLPEIIDEYKYNSHDAFFEKYNLDKNKKTLVIFPGSRVQEIKKHLKLINEAAELITRNEELNVIMAGVSSVSKEVYEHVLENKNIKLIFDDQYNILKYSDFALVKSGTTTIETACFGIPMIVYYRTSLLSLLIGRMLVKIKFFCMVNIIAGKKVVPELLQSEVNPGNIFSQFHKIFNDTVSLNIMRNELKNVKEKLGEPGASVKAARIIFNSV
jgi:lipid-A-disaccharide synthase